jgi:hypothetical protein
VSVQNVLTVDDLALRELILSKAKIGCPNEEIASVVEMSQRTLERKYGALLKKGRDLARNRIRERQFQIMEANQPTAATMSIWLGKQLLGQRDGLALDARGATFVVNDMNSICSDKQKVKPKAKRKRKSLDVETD